LILLISSPEALVVSIYHAMKFKLEILFEFQEVCLCGITQIFESHIIVCNPVIDWFLIIVLYFVCISVLSVFDGSLFCCVDIIGQIASASVLCGVLHHNELYMLIIRLSVFAGLLLFL
jgi:hypothetical protein